MKICGIDEAGRGCCAGLYVISGVVLDSNIIGINDSKKLSHKKRILPFNEIKRTSTYHIVMFSSKDVDDYGLSQLTKIALNEIKKTIKADRYIFDGKCNYDIVGIETIIKADAIYKEVGASSILSKVTHDLDMFKCHKMLPMYGFDSHKGYITKKHKEAISRYGYSKYHRKSYNIRL